MARCPEDAIEITLDVNTRIQILDELNHLAGARKHQFAAFCRQEQCLVVWADEVETLIPSAEALEQRMIAYVWSGRHHELAALEAETKDDDSEDGWVDRDAEKERELEEAEGDEEGKIGANPDEWEMRDKRPMMLYAPLISGFAIILCFVFIGSGMRKFAVMVTTDDRSIGQGSFARWQLYPIRTHGRHALWLPARYCKSTFVRRTDSSSLPFASAETFGRLSDPSPTCTKTRTTTLVPPQSE